ncbi:putative niacin/nicotinamide transporter NaiP [Lactobacillus helveticus]|nr:hypothetical protein [Lactobacillus helveticus]NRO27613.1 putative niacin/nicotinamide transporter NaiP [Lactobacillus helveticus]
MDNTQQRPTFIFLIIGTAWLFDAMDVGLLSFIMPIVHQQWALSNSQTGLISSVSTIGMVCGGFYFGHLADRIGRIGAIFGPLLIGVLMDHQISISIIFVIFMVSLLIGSIAVLALPSADQQPNGEVTQ